jgi:hypothetical protein
MTEVSKEAFASDPLMEFCFNRPNVPRTPKEELIAKHLERMATPEFVYYKAVDAENPSGSILASPRGTGSKTHTPQSKISRGAIPHRRYTWSVTMPLCASYAAGTSTTSASATSPLSTWLS